MKVIAKNKRAFHDFEIKDRLIAGIKLEGHEVKSVKAGNIKLQGAYVTIYKNEMYLANAHIPPYEHANNISLKGYDPERFRKLLVTKKQLLHFMQERKAKRLVIVPLAVLLDKGLIKVEIALAKPLKKYDKKRRKKEREEERKVKKIKRTVEVIY